MCIQLHEGTLLILCFVGRLHSKMITNYFYRRGDSLGLFGDAFFLASSHIKKKQIVHYVLQKNVDFMIKKQVCLALFATIIYLLCPELILRRQY